MASFGSEFARFEQQQQLLVPFFPFFSGGRLDCLATPIRHLTICTECVNLLPWLNTDKVVDMM